MPRHIGASLSFHPTEKPFVLCHSYGTERTPILSLRDRHASLTVYAHESFGKAEQLKFARELLAAVTAYVDAVETYTTDSTDTPERR